MERYLHEAQLYTHEDCKKWKDVAMRATLCGKRGLLFPMVYGSTRFNNKRERINAKYITNAIARMLTAAHVDDAGFTSKSMRKGVSIPCFGEVSSQGIRSYREGVYTPNEI